MNATSIRGSVPDQNFHRFYEFFLHTGIRIVFEKLPIIVNVRVLALLSSNRLAEREDETHERRMKSARFKAVKNAAIFRPIKYRNGAEKWETVRFRPTMAVRYPRVSAHYPRQKYGRNMGGEGLMEDESVRLFFSHVYTPRQFLAPFVSVFVYKGVSASRPMDGVFETRLKREGRVERNSFSLENPRVFFQRSFCSQF